MATAINAWLTADVNRRFERCQAWSEAIHFYHGNQWIRYVQHQYRFESIPLTDANRTIERPVTNYFWKWILTNVAGLSNKPELIVEPASEDPQQKTSAEVADVVLDYLWDEHNKGDQYYEANLWGQLCGPVFRASEKVPCGKSYGDTPLYDVKPRIVAPFHIIFDGVPSRFDDIGTIMETTVMRVDDVKVMFNRKEKGYYPDQAALVEPEAIGTIPVSLFEGLKNIIPGETSTALVSGDGGNLLDSCIVKKVFVRPSEKYPQGQMIVVAGKYTVFADDSPYFYLDGKFWHPYRMWEYSKAPGNIWGIGLGSQLVKIQRRLNSIDALIAYNRKTMAIGIIWSPKGSGVPAGSFVGIPGQVVEYQESLNGKRPEREQGVPLPPQVMQERMQLIDDGNSIAGSADVRSGENPRGVNTVGQLQIMTEQAELSKSKQTESWEQFIQTSEYLDLLNFRSCNLDVTDPKTVEKLRGLGQDVTNFDWTQFKGSVIQENVTVRIEKGSSVNRSRILLQDTALKLAEAMLLPEAVNDPQGRKKFLELFGLSKFFTDNNVDQKYAEKSIEMMIAGKYPPVIEGIHNPDVQIPVLVRFMKDPKYLELPPKTQMLFQRRHEELIALLTKAMEAHAQSAGAPPMQPLMNGNRPAPQPKQPQPTGAQPAPGAM